MDNGQGPRQAARAKPAGLGRWQYDSGDRSPATARVGEWRDTDNRLKRRSASWPAWTCGSLPTSAACRMRPTARYMARCTTFGAHCSALLTTLTATRPTPRSHRGNSRPLMALRAMLPDLDPQPAALFDLEDRLGCVCGQLVRAGGR